MIGSKLNLTTTIKANHSLQHVQKVLNMSNSFKQITIDKKIQ
jgi:hypothetical protein